MAIDSKNLLMAVKAFSRANPLPLDASEIHDSLAAAEAYAQSAKAYAGQTIKVLQDGKYETYVLNPQEGLGLTLGKVTVDASEIKNYVQVIEELPISNQEQGIIYIDSSLTGYVWTGSGWKILFEQIQFVDENDEVSTLTPSQAITNLNSEVDTIQETLDVLTGEGQGSVDYKISEAVAKANHLKRQVVFELPSENIDTNTIYMMLNGETGDDIYDEWMYLEDAWEKLGRTTVDLTDYYTIDQANDVFVKLAALENYAKKSDIPTVPTNVSAFVNDSGYLVKENLSEYAKLTDIPDVSEFIKAEALNGYATEEFVLQQIEDIEIPSLEGYAKLTDIPSLEGYATETWVTNAINDAQLNGGDTPEIDLSIYALKAQLGQLGEHSTVTDYVDAAVSAATLNVIVFEQVVLNDHGTC